MNLAIIQTSLSTLCDFERVKSLFFLSDVVKQNMADLSLSWWQEHNITIKCEAWLNALFDKMGFVLTFFYEREKFQFDQIEIDSLLESFSFFLLLVTVIFYWFETAFHSKGQKQKYASSMVKLSNLSLTFLLVTRWVTSHHFPLSNLYESLIFLSWSLTVIHLVLEKISNTLLIGVLLSPITLFINGFALFTLPAEMQRGNFLTPALQSNWLMMHVTVMISSYAALLSGSILAIAFLVVTRDINKNHNGSTFCEAGPFSQSQNVSNVITTGPGIKGKIDAEHKSSSLVLQNKNDPMFVESEGKLLASNSENLLFDKIINNNFNNLVFVGQNKQVLPDSKLSVQKPLFTETRDFSSKNKKRNSNFLLKPFSFRPISQNGLNDFFEEENILQNRTNLAITLDNLSYRTIGIGFPLLTIGILSGSVWANEAWGSYWSWDPKETWALITWFLFAIYLHTRITKGLQGEKPAIIATIGFVVVWVCFLGVNLASQGLHTYGWLQ